MTLGVVREGTRGVGFARTGRPLQALRAASAVAGHPSRISTPPVRSAPPEES